MARSLQYIVLILTLLLLLQSCGRKTTTEEESAETLPQGDAVNAISLGQKHTCILKDSVLKCFGYNYFGQLGITTNLNVGDKKGDSPQEVQLSENKTAIKMSLGAFHTCAILSDSTLKCFGQNSYGQLGLGHQNSLGDEESSMGDNLSAINLGTQKTAKEVSGGLQHTCVLLSDSKLKCFGNNFYGQLGLGHTTPLGLLKDQMGDNLSPLNLGTGKTVLQVCAGAYHNCAVLNDSSVKCWGHNESGRLGLSDSEKRGDSTSSIGDNLSPVNLGTNKTAIMVAAGLEHNCVLLNDSSVKCFGGNFFGQLGLAHRNATGDAAGEMGDNLSPVPLGRNKTAIKIAVGDYHSCALLNDSTVKCWGQNSYGQLGQESLESLGDEAFELGDNLSPINVGSERTVIDIAAGGNHTCVLLDDYTAKCWGENTEGQLGQNDRESRGGGLGDMGDNLLPLVL